MSEAIGKFSSVAPDGESAPHELVILAASAGGIPAIGGLVIAQGPATALQPGMPRAAIATGAVDYVLPLEEIGPTLVRLTTRGPNEKESTRRPQ